MDYMWVIQNYKFSYSVIVLVQKSEIRRSDGEGTPRRYVKLVFHLVF